jgi:HD superfamily phosphohydrolase
MNEFFLLQSNIIPFTPMAEVLWELVWQLRVPLNPCERDLLNTRSLRRLEFACTFGAGDWGMPTHHSRLFHVRGVFALTAHFRPDDEVLRLATLLYDVGHGPFSHSAEALPGFDHHQAERAIISGEEVDNILYNANVALII